MGTTLAAYYPLYGRGSENLADSKALFDGLLVCQQLSISHIDNRQSNGLANTLRIHLKISTVWVNQFVRRKKGVISSYRRL